jgi:hypothetical protein
MTCGSLRLASKWAGEVRRNRATKGKAKKNRSGILSSHHSSGDERTTGAVERARRDHGRAD